MNRFDILNWKNRNLKVTRRKRTKSRVSTKILFKLLLWQCFASMRWKTLGRSDGKFILDNNNNISRKLFLTWRTEILPNIQELARRGNYTLNAKRDIPLILTLNSVLTTSKRPTGRFIRKIIITLQRNVRVNIDRARARWWRSGDKHYRRRLELVMILLFLYLTRKQ